MQTAKKALVIGAGIHGVTVGIELARSGYGVTIIDAKEDMLLGTSAATHGRIHLGYHYPRSKETALECIQGYFDFIRDYRDCLISPDFYYAIEKYDSHVNAAQYREALQNLGLQCNSAWPEECFLRREFIEDSFKVREVCFDIWKLKDIVRERFSQLGVEAIFSFEVKEGSAVAGNKVRLVSSSGDVVEIEADLIVNCTYTYTNNVQSAFSVHEDLTPYKFENTEIAVVESEQDIPALTVMDGPFITILPYAGKKNHYLVYDKINSVVSQETGTLYQPPKMVGTNWEKMKKHGLKYYPFFEDLEYRFSIYGSRPISLKTEDDGRATRIVKHDYPIDFYSILEGKFVSAPLIAKMFAKSVRRNSEFTKKTALIGHTGFIGSNLRKDFLFSEYYNSKNVADIEGEEFDLIVSCGNSAAKWKANQEPDKDLEAINTFMRHVRKAKAKRFVLISTIDVYGKPHGVDEDSMPGNLDGNPYGKHRLMLEDFVRSHFTQHHIIRLPIVYGHNFRKNFIYDALNEHQLEKVDINAVVQIYNVRNLIKDIFIAIDHDLRVLNVATEPMAIKDIYREVFRLEDGNPRDTDFRYDMRTKHSGLFSRKDGYAYGRAALLEELREFRDEYEAIRV